MTWQWDTLSEWITQNIPNSQNLRKSLKGIDGFTLLSDSVKDIAEGCQIDNYPDKYKLKWLKNDLAELEK